MLSNVPEENRSTLEKRLKLEIEIRKKSSELESLHASLLEVDVELLKSGLIKEMGHDMKW